jgi:hypothetical protein
MTARIDAHPHLIPPGYRAAVRAAAISAAGGRALPAWTPEAALALRDKLEVTAGVVSGNAAPLFPRLAHPSATSRRDDRRTPVRAAIKTGVVRAAVKLVDPTRT